MYSPSLLLCEQPHVRMYTLSVPGMWLSAAGRSAAERNLAGLRRVSWACAARTLTRLSGSDAPLRDNPRVLHAGGGGIEALRCVLDVLHVLSKHVCECKETRQASSTLRRHTHRSRC